LVAAANNTVDNGGFIDVTGYGIEILGDSTIENTGSIIGAYGIIGFSNATIGNTGFISAGDIAIDMLEGGSVKNLGTVTGGIAGVLLRLGGTVENAGTIVGLNGTQGIFSQGGSAGPATIENTGLVEAIGAGGVGIEMDAGGSLQNGGTIIGPSGVHSYGDVTIKNTGLIDATGTGVSVGGDGTVVNSGTIEGQGSGAVDFTSGFDNLLIIDPGAVFIGQVAGADAVGADGSSVLELGAGHGTLGSVGSQFTDFQTIDFGAGASWAISGDVAGLAAGEVINGFGAHDTIVLDGFAETGESYVPGTGLVLSQGGTTATLDITGVTAFHVTTNGTNTTITTAAVTPALRDAATRIPAPVTAVAPGTIFAVTGSQTTANLLNDGTVAIGSGASLDVTSAIDPASIGIFELTSKGSLEIASLLGTNVKMEFLGTTPANKLTIDDAANFGRHIGSTSFAGPLLEDFKAGNIIDLKGIASTGLKLNYTPTTGDLHITTSTGGVITTLQFQNASLGAGSFHVASDSTGGTFLTHS
jgi:hypothetical protein